MLHSNLGVLPLGAQRVKRYLEVSTFLGVHFPRGTSQNKESKPISFLGYEVEAIYSNIALLKGKLDRRKPLVNSLLLDQ